MKKHSSTILLIIIFIIGLSLLLYPSVSDWWNSMHQSRAIATYTEQVADIDNDQYEELWNAAREYNQSLTERANSTILTDEQKEQYNALLNVGDNGIMGYIEIPSIDVTLPVYHGTDAAVLQIAVGHLEWTSLPVGGESSHCVVSGHRGLPSATLFTDLDKLVVGDIFLFRILDEVLTYEVDQILIVEPNDIEALKIEEGKDLCTLVTCTPYGVNSHRMLVRGHRVENEEQAQVVRVTADAIQIEPVIVAPFVAIPMLLILLVILLVSTRKKK
ncbi:MAG: class C sortase [Lachnospiraceae bacterium]|nr:class C sortase [Lachnospiraceae bacterium]